MSKNTPSLALEQIKELFLRQHGNTFTNEIADWLRMNDTFYNFRGTSPESAIWMKETINSTELVIPKINYSNLQPYFRGTDTTNKGLAPSLDSMNVKRSGVKLKMMSLDYDYPIAEIGVDFISQMYSNLKDGIAKMHVSQVYNQLAKCFAQNAVYYANKPNISEQKTDEFYHPLYIDDNGVIPFKASIPAYIPICGLDALNAAGDVVSFDRCVFGGDDLNTSVAPANTVAGAIANAGLFGLTTAVAINNHKSAILTVSHLQRMIELASVGSRVGGTEDPVNPLMTSTFNNTPSIGYAIFISQDAFEGLRRTEEYKNQLNRAFREVAGQPSLYNGSRFVMQIGNTDVYVSSLLNQMQFTTTVTDRGVSKINYSVLMGKQAIVQIASAAQGVKDWQTVTDYNQDTFEIIYKEMTGYKPIRFRSKNKNKANILVERGLIHSFTLSPQNLAV